ncbi:hypothetical protein QMN58_32120, partial [Escherichia coli]|nr:hypothetical protein [Escherichia coli]
HGARGIQHHLLIKRFFQCGRVGRLKQESCHHVRGLIFAAYGIDFYQYFCFASLSSRFADGSPGAKTATSGSWVAVGWQLGGSGGSAEV